MLVLSSSLVNVPIMSLQTGDSLGVTESPIIDPRKLQIIAFYASGVRITAPSILHVSDIREVGSIGFIVDGSDNIMELDGSLVRLQEVIDLNFTLINKPIIDQTKRKLGKLSEYVVENEGFTIQKLHVSQSIMRNFGTAELVIGRSQIVEITDKAIIVRSGTVQDSPGLMQMMNPFRKHDVAAQQFQNSTEAIADDESAVSRSKLSQGSEQ